MNVLIVDDEPLARARLTRLISKLRPSFNLLPGAENGEMALQQVHQHIPDLVFVDIEMPVMDGITLAAELKQITPPPAIIFVTAYSDRALQAFSVVPQGYLVKPVEEKNLDELLCQLEVPHRAQHALKQQAAISFIKQGITQHIALSDIRLIRSEDKYVRIYTASNSELIKGSLKQLLARFPEHLLRVHRNTLVNQAFIDKVYQDTSGHWVRVRDCDEKIEISRREWRNLKQKD